MVAVAVALQINRFEALPSTNTLALDLARADAPAWTTVVADRQTAGRGRLRRVWHSPPGCGLYCSVILRPSLLLEHLPRLTLAGGVAICRALEAMGVPAPRIKWPNDILLAGRKVGGILTETAPLTGAGSTPPPVVIGIGLNLSTPLAAFPPAFRNRATSIAAATGLALDPESLLEKILAHLQAEVALLEDAGFDAILEEWRRRDGMRGQVLTWLNTIGEKVEGIGLGVDAAGLYHIRDRHGTVHEVLSGDLDLAWPGQKD